MHVNIFGLARQLVGVHSVVESLMKQVTNLGRTISAMIKVCTVAAVYMYMFLRA